MERTILIAEDDEASILYLKKILTTAHYNIVWAPNGEESVRICETNSNINLVLMDLKMPVMSGYEATKLIKAKYPDMPIIAQTAYALKEDKIRYKDLFDEYVTKPIQKEELMEKISKHIRK